MKDFKPKLSATQSSHGVFGVENEAVISWWTGKREGESVDVIAVKVDANCQFATELWALLQKAAATAAVSLPRLESKGPIIR